MVQLPFQLPANAPSKHSSHHRAMQLIHNAVKNQWLVPFGYGEFTKADDGTVLSAMQAAQYAHSMWRQTFADAAAAAQCVNSGGQWVNGACQFVP